MRDTIKRLASRAAANPRITVGLAGLRVAYGLYWLYSAAWKVPLEVGRPGERSLWYWLIQGVQHPTFAPYATFVREVVLPNFVLFGALVFLVELFVGLSLVSGALTRLGTLAGMGMSFAIFLTVGSIPGESPFFYLGLFLVHLLLFLTRSGRYYGLDAALSRRLALFLILSIGGVACESRPRTDGLPLVADRTLDAATYVDKARGYWIGALIGNYTGLPHEGRYLDRPGSAGSVEWALLEEYTTDDDTLIEWVNIHILEEHGLLPSYALIRDEWVAHINHDIWWANRTARDLMAQGLLPPQTGQPQHNPHSGWNIDAQIESELFGVIAPGRPREARDRASYFARTTSNGDPVDAAAFYAVLYSLAFFDSDPGSLIAAARAYFQPEATVVQIADAIVRWHAAHPDDWHATRRLIRDAYDVDPSWNAARVNFASTLMALLYGGGDFERTVTLAVIAGWDSDCNATTAAGLVGVMHGYRRLPSQLRDAAGHVYINIDVTGHLPQRETLDTTTARLQALAEQAILASGGHLEDYPDGRTYYIPRDR